MVLITDHRLIQTFDPLSLSTVALSHLVINFGMWERRHRRMVSEVCGTL